MHPQIRAVICSFLLGLCLSGAAAAQAPVDTPPCGDSDAPQASCVRLDPLTIIGTPEDARDVAGGATVVTHDDLEEFTPTDVQRALRQVPGISLQVEDGYGLRPNISIRGTPTERSSRITLLEDNVLIAPAPYAAPAAYYFPTFGRIHAMEVLKGPASITQGPYTIGGALNLLSTPIPAERAGQLLGEYGADATWRVHGWYGEGEGTTGWLVETHQWGSDGYQHLDRSDRDTGFDKQDYVAKLRFSSDPGATVQQQLDIKLQVSDETSEQSYLGLTDADFATDPLRRYGVSAFDEMDNEHEQVMLSWRIEPSADLGFVITAYDNGFERAWYKTEGIDFDGSPDAQSFTRTGWAGVVDAINRGQSLSGFTPDQLQAFLDGADTAPGSIELRNNSREYYSRGIQFGGDWLATTGAALHTLRFGLRYHEDQEDRLQRLDTWQQLDGRLVLTDRGLEGNAGNRVQDASAWSAWVHDRIDYGDWAFMPGLRFESIEQERTDYQADPDDLSGRGPEDVRRVRRNSEDVWLPGLSAMYRASEHLTWLAGVHKGFSAPGNQDGVDPEESINYEAGFRFTQGVLALEAIAFYNDYDNLQGVCTASSGTGCDIGDVFNGDAVRIPGLEFRLQTDLAAGRDFGLPLLVSYTWMDAEFRSDIDDSEFFGDVIAGDPVPYIPDNQLYASLGFERGPWSAYLSGNYTEGVCTSAACGPFQRTDDSATFDLAVHWRLNPRLELYSVLENLTDELDIVGREPYGARPNKARSWLLGARFEF